MIPARTFPGLLIAFTVSSACCPAQAGDAGLLAAPYPGSVPETRLVLGNPPTKAMADARSRTFYTKDPVEKVKAYYAKSLGEFHVSPSGDHIFVHDVLPFGDVGRIVTKRGATVGEGGENFYGGCTAGVTLHGKPANGASSYSVVKAFEILEKAYVLRFTAAGDADPAAAARHLEDPELKELEARYEHLKSSYYPLTDEKRKNGTGGNLTIDEALFDKYFTSPQESRAGEMEALQKKMADLSTQGKYEEAGKLGDRIVQLVSGQAVMKDQVEAAKSFFKEADTYAYATMIVIDMHPSQWDLTPGR